MAGEQCYGREGSRAREFTIGGEERREKWMMKYGIRKNERREDIGHVMQLRR